MAATLTPREVFLNHLSEAARPAFAKLAPDALDALLQKTLQTARAAFSAVELADAPFLSYLAERVQPGDDTARGVESLAAADLYLACACAHGDARAITALESAYFREIDHALSRLNAGPSLVDDVKQRVRQHLFIGQPPGIANYSGSGQLRRWMRVIAVRTLHRLRDKTRNEVPAENNLIEALPDGAADPELLHLKQHYREAFRAAFADSIAALSSEDRVLLRQHFVDGLNIDELAALHHVHRATAARWLAAARENVADKTRKLLLQKIKGQRADFDSILRLVQSQLDLSIRGHLK